MSDGNKFQTSREIFDHSIWQDIVKFRIFFYIYGKAVFSKDGVWKGNVHVKRGQFLRSYRKLIEDLEYVENKQVKKYSLTTVQRKIKELVQEERLRLHETELGTLFEVVNYEQYQGFGSSKNQDLEQDMEHSWNTDGTVTEHSRNNNKNVKNDKNEKNDKDIRSKSKKQNFEPIHLELAEYLLKAIKENHPEYKEPPNLNNWAVTFRLMIDRDNRTEQAIRNCINWVSGHSFWHKNILSADKLRKQYDRLVIEAKEDKAKFDVINGGRNNEDHRSSYPKRDFSKYKFR
ncbi:hypothetical protein ACSU64_27760 [Bacillaceae bacterium C204]|uniref:hypothetical protein n=1 Tax=Neobacillus sp. 204 TaxID=3383351 RepID=UPI00397C1452